MNPRVKAGAVFLSLGVFGLVIVFAYAMAGGDPLESSLSRREPVTFTLASLLSTLLGLLLLLNIGPVSSLIIKSD